MKRLYDALAEAIKQGRAVVLVTLIEVQGSVPRQPGSKMLVFEDSKTIGTVGGGKLEFEAIEEAQKLLNQKTLKRQWFDLTENNDMACGGRVEVMFESLGRSDRLILFGGGHVGQALAPLAHQAGFAVTVVDDRPEYANETLFPMAERIESGPYRESLKHLVFDEHSFVVIVTHGHQHDAEILAGCLDQPAAYLGMIGSKHKVRKTFNDLKDNGVTDEALANVHAPIGLNIGAETPFEIAVSILAEMIAVRSGTETGRLAMKMQPHSSTASGAKT